MDAIPTMGWLRRIAPVEPKNRASPKAKMPPSEATSQYPPPPRVGAMPTIGWFSLSAPVDPAKWASPNEKIPPSEATSQYPLPVRAGRTGTFRAAAASTMP